MKEEITSHIDDSEEILREDLSAATDALNNPDSDKEARLAALKAMTEIAPALGSAIVSRHRKS